MAFVKLVKNNAFFKRYQVKYRRRRENKTDYKARKALIHQEKDKYDRPKYRLVTRFTNSKVIAQITKSEIIGDKVVYQATSSELKKFGLTAGLTNYASAYATGLLLARRLLKDLKMDGIYKGNTEVNGEYYNVDQLHEEGKVDRRPFKAVLDLGLNVSTTGARVYGVLKGACDGGIHVPHSESRFPGAYKEEDNSGYEAEVHQDRIFGRHVDNYMETLKGDKEAFQRQFGKWSKALQAAKCNKVADLMKKVHAEIYKSPAFAKKAVAKNPDRKKHPSKGKKVVRLGKVQKKKNALKRIEIATKMKK